MDNFSKQIYEAGINDGRAEGMDILKTPPEEHQYFKDLLAKKQ